MQDLDAVAAPQAPRQACVELACLLCGDMVGVLLDDRVIRPRAAGSLRIDKRTMRCRIPLTYCFAMMMPMVNKKTMEQLV